MARIRYLKPDFFFDDDLAELSFECRLFFQGLWCYADRKGRLEDKPKVLKAQIMPYDNVNADKILTKLSDKFIMRYEIENHKYIQINNFLKHQKPHHTEKDSIIPECNGVITVNEPSKDDLKEEDKDKDKDKEKKKKHLDFVFLTDDELKKLQAKFPLSFEKKIEDLNRYGHTKPKKFKEYASHYHTILTWAEDEPPESKIPKTSHNEKPMKRTPRQIDTPEAAKINKEMVRLVKEKPKGWQEQNKKLQIELNKTYKDINVKTLGEVIKEKR